MSSGFLKAAPLGTIDPEQGVIEGVSVCTVGEASGHGVHLDSEFIRRVQELGNARRQGLKARFGHPNMCSTALGTFIGRFKNFREGTTLRDGETVKCALADLFVSNEAKETPHGDLHNYIFGMAASEPDMFGTSIVFTKGRTYRRDKDGNKAYRHVRYTRYDVEVWYTNEADERLSEDQEKDLSKELFVECDELHACDAVDEPAANEGLFSRFSQETIAGQITEFLDLHPQVFTAIESNPSILEALARYGKKVDEFMNRYREYREHNKEDAMSDEPTPSAESLEDGAPVVAEPEAPQSPAAELETPAEEPATELAEPETPEPAELETPAEPGEEELTEPAAEPEDTPPEQAAEPTPGESLARDEFTRIADEFGADIAVQTARDGGTYEDARELHYKALDEENATLRARVAELEGAEGATPAAVTEEKKAKSVFRGSRQ